ncbi:MAG TPA: AAA family ATPase [Acidimicrobiales bacterium]|nr:AAA family ATPase [Acidimicrobiales bacterium]
MKLGIVGKGGIGKTTVAALLAETYAAQGKRVLAVDTDSNPNLAYSLGLDAVAADQVPLLPRSLVVGTGSGAVSPADLVLEYGVTTPSNVTLLHAMRVTQAGAGCTCSSHATVRSLLGAAIDEEADVTLVDMEAGLEHLSRSGGTLAYVDILLVVMEPTRKSVLTAGRTLALADELGIPRVYGVGNKANLPEDAEFFASACAEYGVPLAKIIPYDDDVVEADRQGTVIAPGKAPAVRAAVAELVEFLDSNDEQRRALFMERERIDRRLAELQLSD